MNSTLINPLFEPQLIQAPFVDKATGGRKLVNMAHLGMFQAMLGSEGGYHTEGDILYTTADGVDPNELWAEFQETLTIFNQRRQTLVSILTFPVTNPVERVAQVGDVDFQRATEFGLPKAVRLEQSYFLMGYDFQDYDVATRYTWKYLRDADRRAVEAVHRAILDADNRLVFSAVMGALFDNRKNTTFDGTHSHYIVSAGAALDSQDLENAVNHISHHGYGQEQGTQFVHVMNSAQTAIVRQFRAGATVNGVVCNYDFIPAPNQPTLFVPNAEGLLGERPPTSWQGLPVIGSYGNALIVEEDYIPAGYVLTLGSGGSGDLQNPVGLREHANPAYRGLRLLPGNQQAYPLVDSEYARAFGTGVRQRAGAVITQIKASGTYDIPAAYNRDNLATG
jgi:hypothetical protein